MAGLGGADERAWTSSSAASAMRMRRLAISSSAMLLRSWGGGFVNIHVGSRAEKG